MVCTGGDNPHFYTMLRIPIQKLVIHIYLKQGRSQALETIALLKLSQKGKLEIHLVQRIQIVYSSLPIDHERMLIHLNVRRSPKQQEIY